MQQGILALVEADAGTQQLVVVGAPGVKHQPGVRATGQAQAHIDASGYGVLQCRQQLRVGYEVSIGQPDLALRAAQCRNQGDVDQAERVFRRAADGAHHLVTASLHRREVMARQQWRPTLLGPGHDEQLLQLSDDRPLQA
ncbi:hypothetical protein D9M68_563930 [compost metagenome]